MQKEEGQESNMGRALSRAVRCVRGHNLRITDEASGLAVDGIGPAIMKVQRLAG